MVTNTPDVLTEEVADTTIGLLINTVREMYAAEKWLRDGDWVENGNYRLSRLTLRGRSVGIFGMGRIGRAVARRLEAFGLPIAYHNRRKVEGLAYEYHATLKGLAEAVDTLICIAPGGAATEKAINAEVLSALGSNGVFVNIGRGSAVDEAALAAALESGTIAAAGLDVFADEPNVPQALLDASNTSLLPHVGSASEHTRRAMADLCVDNLVAWFTERRPLTPVPETVKVKARG
jgi:lactate dehydrogenase-like 2-hydroxyacid dehydrogenase